MTFRQQVDVRSQTSHKLRHSSKDREADRLASSADSNKTHPFSAVDRSRHEVMIVGSQHSNSNRSLQKQYHGLVAPEAEVNPNSENLQKEAATIDLTSQNRHIALESLVTGMVFPSPSSKKTRPLRLATESASANGMPQ